MSFPENPLKKFRSYSYHHILLAGNSTTVADAFDRNEIQTSQLSRSKINPETGLLNVYNTLDESGQYVVLINGMTDGDLIIDELKWQNIMVPTSDEGGIDRTASMLLEGQMTVIEPKGFRFLNHINIACDSLQTDPNGLFFMIKTIFVGYSSEGEQGISKVQNISPLVFIMYDISSSFDAAGTVYNLEFVGLSNGAAKLPHVLNVSESVSGFAYYESRDATLAGSMKNVEALIQSNYEKHVKTTQNLLPPGETIENSFRLIKYRIILDEPYRSLYFIDAAPEQVSETTVLSPHITVGPEDTIEDIIHNVMQKSSRVLKDAVGDNHEKQKYIYKILSTVKSSVISQLSDGGTIDPSYEVIYKVNRYPIKTSTKTKGNTFFADPELVDEGNYMEFDYFYTGKNVDILDLDIRMKMGLAFFQTMTPTSNITDAEGYVDQKPHDDGETTPTSPAYAHNSKRKLTPLFAATLKSDHTQTHSTRPVDKSNFDSLLERHASIEALETKMTIHGNPNLLNDLILSPDDIIRDTGQSIVDGESVGANWHKGPLLAKVNISMPDDSSNAFKPTPFWYQGFFHVLSVENNFKDGTFTQTLDMMSLPLDLQTNVSSSEDAGGNS